MSDFARGARVRPKKPSEEIPFDVALSLPEFFAITAICAVREYKIRDREAFLRWCGNAFDAALRSIPP